MYVLIVAFILACTTGSNHALAGDIREQQTTYGFKVGLITPGIWYVGDYEYEPDAGYTLGGFLDYKLGPKISGGLALDIHKFNAYEESGTLFDIGVTLKALIYGANSKFVFRPGFGIGYGMLGEMGIYESSTYMLLKGNVEMVILRPSGFSWLVDLGIMGAPTGGNNDADMYLDPGLFVRAGLVF
jgi:hypothetical protein